MTCISLPCGKPLHIVLIPGRSSRTAKFSVKNRNWKTLVKTSFTGDSSPSNNIKPTTGRETGSGRSNFHCRLYGPCLLNALVRDSGVCGSVIPLQAAIAIGDRPAAGSKSVRNLNRYCFFRKYDSIGSRENCISAGEQYILFLRQRFLS